MINLIVSCLCALTALLCAWLLLRAYWDRHIALLWWVGVFFLMQVGLNLLLVVDKLVLDADLSLYRYMLALVAVGVLLYGLIMRTEVD